jgi:hypothetical protein
VGLTPERAARHIAEWSERLGPFPRNAPWPKYLFHAAHVTTAVQILRSGRLACRSRLGGVDHDVANQGALRNNPKVHDFARLYFRPKNKFHVKTEGIKCVGDPFRDRHQMSIPVMLAFDSLSVLTLPEAGFSSGMLSKVRRIGRDDRFFDSIPMERVYHDSVPEADGEAIQDARMAEVVVPGHLPLSPHLRWVLCRTPLDRRTLLHLLGADAEAFRDRIVVEPMRSSAFLHHGLYLTRVDFSSAGLRLDLHLPRRGPSSGRIKIRLTNEIRAQAPDRYDLEIRGHQQSVTVDSIHATVESCWKIELDDVLAFQAPIPSETAVLTV